MTAECASQDDLVLLLDGELTENRATRIKQHIVHCVGCQRELQTWRGMVEGIAAPVDSKCAPFAKTRVLAQLEQDTTSASTTPTWRAKWVFALAGICTMATLALFVTTSVLRSDPGTFSSRGSATPSSLRRDVGIYFHTLSDTNAPAPVRGGMVLMRSSPVVVSYINRFSADSVYLLTFAVDSDGTVHWLYPAYLDSRTNPDAVLLPETQRESSLGEAVVLDNPPLGTLRLVWLLSTQKGHVSSIESLTRENLELHALQTRWPDAEVGEIRVRIQN